jgi:hypothetical protein
MATTAAAHPFANIAAKSAEHRAEIAQRIGKLHCESDYEVSRGKNVKKFANRKADTLVCPPLNVDLIVRVLAGFVELL